MTILGIPRITFDAVADRVGVTFATAHRWATEGLRHKGEIVKLGSIKVGGRRYTTEADLEAFLRRLNPGLAAGAAQAQPAGPSAA